MENKTSSHATVFRCDQCHDEFTSLDDLRSHKQIHAGSNDGELQNLKTEILKEIKSSNKKNKIAWGSLLVSGIMAVLLLVSLVQAAQSINILYKLKNNSIKPANAGVTETSLPSSLDNLPDMVGGC
jgi:hypothetical protein